ncbi:MAG TPA: anti-sigma factor [Solirubrobacterales bacterium]|nr:anti-sigma factor [Solirubrobacterales bacterium]
MSENGHERRRDDLAAYLLGALEPGEAAELERHLAGCEECRTELEWLRPAAQVLPESVVRVEAPPELRGRLMEQVRSEAEGTPTPSHARRWSIGGWSLRPVVGLAALVLVVAAVAAYAIGSGDSGSGNTTTVVEGHSPGVVAEVVRDGSSGTLHLANLHQLPPDKVLQAWVQRGKRVVSAKALFVPNQDGTASATIDDMEGVNTVMVTAEPRGGSLQPTSAPIASVSIPN